jgi:SAM-dependent methyltransferase
MLARDRRAPYGRRPQGRVWLPQRASGAVRCDTRAVSLGNDPVPVSWQRLRTARALAAERFPSPVRLPLLSRPSDRLYGLLKGDERVLDVGAGDGTRRERLAQRFPRVAYVSVDPDREAGADHRRVADAPGTYDVATLFEVLEHLPPAEGLLLLRSVRAKLRRGAHVVVSVPATHTPGRWLRDCTHVTPWAHDELGGALLLTGYSLVSLHRTYPGPFLRRCLRRALLGPLGHLFGLDYAYSVVATGRRAD